MNKYIYSILCFCIITKFYTQTFEKIIEARSQEICDCLEKKDKEIQQEGKRNKFTDCIEMTSKDKANIEKFRDLDYQISLNDYLVQNCITFEKIINNLKEYAKKTEDKNNKDVVGRYSLSNGNHEPTGSPSLYLLENNKYYILYFGGAKFGTWKLYKDKTLRLIPFQPKQMFMVYGRHNKKLKDSTNIAFIGDDFNYNTLIHFGELNGEINTFSPIFNKDANCYSYPYTKRIKNHFPALSLALNRNSYENTSRKVKTNIFTFENTEKYNDFIVYNYSKLFNDKEITAKFKDNVLQFEENEKSKKRAFTEEENGLFKSEYFMPFNEFNTTEIYYNSGYNKFKKEVIEAETSYYTYQEDINAYQIRKDLLYNRGDVEISDYDNQNIVNKFELLTLSTEQKEYIKIGEKSLLYMVCEE